MVPRYERYGIRRCVHGDDLMFYRLQPEQIEVIHVLQGARDHCTRFVSEALVKHERAAFLSGNDHVDLYFPEYCRETVSQDVKRKYAACYVLIERSTGKVAGFYTLSAHSIPLNDVAPELAKKLPPYPSVPVVLIGWTERDLAFRGAGVGSLLLDDAISRAAKCRPVPTRFAPMPSPMPLMSSLPSSTATTSFNRW